MKIASATALAAAALLPMPSAFADSIGAYGPVAQIAVHGPQSDEYGVARGRLVVDEGQQLYRSYQWGGTACNGKYMTEADVANLLLALRDRSGLNLTPIWKAGAGRVRCLVSYRITGSDVVQ